MGSHHLEDFSGCHVSIHHRHREVHDDDIVHPRFPLLLFACLFVFVNSTTDLLASFLPIVTVLNFSRHSQPIFHDKFQHLDVEDLILDHEHPIHQTHLTPVWLNVLVVHLDFFLYVAS